MLNTRTMIVLCTLIIAAAVLYLMQMMVGGADTKKLFDYTYVCSGDATFRVVFADDFETATLHVGSESVDMIHAISASGMRFTDGNYVFWSRGEDAFLERDGAIVMMDCRKKD